jgi:hypothetical protein
LAASASAPVADIAGVWILDAEHPLRSVHIELDCSERLLGVAETYGSPFGGRARNGGSGAR